MRRLSPIVLCAALLCLSCQSHAPPDASSQADSAAVAEVTPRPLRLGAPLNNANMEISGLAWYGDTLVVLPQYPSRRTGANGRQLYGISRSALAQAVADTTVSIDPFPIPLHANGMSDHATAYEGCEAIAFKDGRAYFLVEGNGGASAMEGHLLRGTVAPGLQSIRLHTATVKALPMQAPLRNMSYEALTLHGDTVLTLFEANGARVNTSPQAHRFTSALDPAGPIPFPALEYRLTDATALDAHGHFWVTNYFYPGERDLLNPGPDSLALRFGTGATHQTSDVVERLVEYRYTPQGIRRTTTPPVWFRLRGGSGRNWEGVARFGDGFLVATDKFPSTILAYVPRSDS